MDGYVDPAIMALVCVVSGIVTVVALIDIFQSRRHVFVPYVIIIVQTIFLYLTISLFQKGAGDPRVIDSAIIKLSPLLALFFGSIVILLKASSLLRYYTGRKT